MSFVESVADIKAIFTDPPGAVGAYLEREPESSFGFLIKKHLPLVVLFWLFTLLSPYVLIRALSSTISLRLITGLLVKSLIPSVLLLGALFLAMAYDKVTEHNNPPRLMDNESPLLKNLALFLHLPLSAAGMFFFIHPALGYGIFFFAGLYCISLSVRIHSMARRISLVRAFVMFTIALSFLLGLLALFILGPLFILRIF